MASSKKERARWKVLYTVFSYVRKWGIKKASHPLDQRRRNKDTCVFTDARLKLSGTSSIMDLEEEGLLASAQSLRSQREL